MLKQSSRTSMPASELLPDFRVARRRRRLPPFPNRFLVFRSLALRRAERGFRVVVHQLDFSQADRDHRLDDLVEIGERPEAVGLRAELHARNPRVDALPLKAVARGA
jgi:hypothetical protein